MIQRALCFLYGVALYAYPAGFRRRFGPELRQTFRDRCQEIFRDPSAARVARFMWAIARDWTLNVIQERFTSMLESLSRNRRRLAYAAASALLVLLASLTVLRPYVIAAPSMENTLRVGDRLIVSRLVGNLERGDLVLFRYPADSSKIFIKRVIGLPGDRIRIENKQVIRNGVRLAEDYATHRTGDVDELRDNFGEVVVPPDAVFVLGDNRENSLDSRYFGFVPRKDVVARPWFVYWSTAARP
jgi:signal peptidase I